MKKNLLRIRAVLLLAFAVMFSGVTSAINVYAFDNSVREGVVAVVFNMKNAARYVTDGKDFLKLEDVGEVNLSHGSGFFVGSTNEDPQYIVTNYHVVEDYIIAGEGGTYIYDTGSTYKGLPVVIASTSCEMRIYYSQDDYDVAYIECYGDIDKLDLAVLRLRNPTSKRHSLKLMAPDDSMVGDTVYTIGYPGNADNVLTGASKYGVEDVTVHKGSINKFAVNEGYGVERIAMDATIQPGNSGGPLVTEEGYVIGVNTNSYSRNTQLIDYYAISGNELIRFLNNNNIPYEMAKSGGGAAVGIIIAIAAVVIVGAAVFVLMKKGVIKSGNNAGAAAGNAAPANANNNAAAGNASNNAASSVKKAVIRSLSAQHNGKVYPVGKAPVTIGRNAAGCEIVYQEGTPGVSGMHCTVSYDSETGIFTLTDLKSSYGTFLMNGTKLNANAPVNLKAGDSFYVGDRANVLRVEVEQ